MSTLVLVAHGSADPRAAANTRTVAHRIRRLRPGLDVRVAFCEQSTPNLRDVLADAPRGTVVTPLLLANAYHAQVDIPAMIADAAPRAAVQADVLGEDGRLVSVLCERVAAQGFSLHDQELGVIVAAVGSSRIDANLRTSTVADALSVRTRWAGATTAFATGPRPTVEEAVRRLRTRGARRIVIAPWFLAPGKITDRIADYARAQGIPMAAPLGAHPWVAETVLDRFDRAAARAGRLAA